MKNRISRKIGIPLTRSGRQRMVGREAGCLLPAALGLLLALVLAYASR
jgi:tetrahydromethanopterin S-methyltransferase subunit G